MTDKEKLDALLDSLKDGRPLFVGQAVWDAFQRLPPGAADKLRGVEIRLCTVLEPNAIATFDPAIFNNLSAFRTPFAAPRNPLDW